MIIAKEGVNKYIFEGINKYIMYVSHVLLHPGRDLDEAGVSDY